MKILFQGAGAIGIAGAALFGAEHETAVVTRAPLTRPRAAHPRRIGRFDASATMDAGSGFKVSDVVATRRVTIASWAHVAADSDSAERSRRPQVRWDVVVLSTRPGDLDADVIAGIRQCRPRFIAITSQVEGDLDLARTMFPRAEVVIFAPAFLSERLDPTTHAPNGSRDVRYWAPAGLPRFLLAGSTYARRELLRELGSLIVPVPMALVMMSPAAFIPFVAELSVQGNRWADLRTNLRRPARVAAEAVRIVSGVPIPMSATIAGLVLDSLERVVPLEFGEYAGRHFARHEGQTLDMLEGWIGDRPRVSAGRRTTAVRSGSRARKSSPHLGELAQALRLRVTR